MPYSSSRGKEYQLLIEEILAADLAMEGGLSEDEIAELRDLVAKAERTMATKLSNTPPLLETDS